MLGAQEVEPQGKQVSVGKSQDNVKNKKIKSSPTNLSGISLEASANTEAAASVRLRTPCVHLL